MSGKRWQRMEELFMRALERTPSERPAFLAEAAADDDALRSEVERLLSTYGKSSSFLEPGSAEYIEAWHSIEANLRLGSSLGRYRLDELVGSGGIGVVYRAFDTLQKRTVAVKVLRPEALADASARKRFLQECHAAESLDHPAIVRVYETGRHEDIDFLVMEFVSGITLCERIGKGPLPLEEALRCARGIAEALGAAHAQGVVHRDIKPANVMLTPAGAVKVLDFGLCHWRNNTPPGVSSAHTQAGMLLGTARYMSPEQAQGLPIDARSDLFSFGAVLYEMLTGRPAFSAPTMVATLAAVLHREPPFDPAIPPELYAVIKRCLNKDLSRRLQSASELSAALDSAQLALTSGGWRSVVRRVGAAVRRRPAWVLPVFASSILAAALWLDWKLSYRTLHAPAKSLIQLTADSGLTTEPALSRDGRMLAYASDRDGDHLEVWLQEPVPGSLARRLTNGVADAHAPAFSPDGATICYRNEADGGALWTLPVAGGEPRLMAHGGRDPKYSPDGKWISYWTGLPGLGDPGAPGSSRAYVAPAAGGPARPLAPDFSARMPVWAPDSRCLLFAGTPSVDPTDYDWWLTDLDGSPPARTGFRRALERSQLNVESMGIMADPREWSADLGGVLFSAAQKSAANLWILPFAQKSWKISGPPARLTLSSTTETYPSSSAGRIVFAVVDSRWNAWSLRGDELKPATDRNSLGFLPSLSADGERMVTVERSGPVAHDLRLGVSRQLLRAWADCLWARLSPDGQEVWFLASGPPAHSTLYTIPFAGGQPVERAVTGFLEKIWDVSPDGLTVLGMTSAAPRGILAIDLHSGGRQPFLSHATSNLYWASFSADGKWVTFTARSGPGDSRIFAAPFHPGTPAGEREWVRVTDGSSNDTAPHWSPDGKRLYFFSDRDGFRCIWSVAFRNGPAGTVTPVRHFHASVRNLSGVPVGRLQLGVARDRLVFTLCEPSGNIYLAR
jgi:Tol biopolymer transport system component